MPKAKKKIASTKTKREIIDSIPGLKAAEIIAGAKEKGITLSQSYAHAIAAKRRAAAGGGAGKGAVGTRGPKPGRPAKSASPRSGGASPSGAKGAERDFLSIAIDLGLRRSQDLLNDLKSRLSSI